MEYANIHKETNEQSKDLPESRRTKKVYNNNRCSSHSSCHQNYHSHTRRSSSLSSSRTKNHTRVFLNMNTMASKRSILTVFLVFCACCISNVSCFCSTGPFSLSQKQRESYQYQNLSTTSHHHHHHHTTTTTNSRIKWENKNDKGPKKNSAKTSGRPMQSLVCLFSSSSSIITPEGLKSTPSFSSSNTLSRPTTATVTNNAASATTTGRIVIRTTQPQDLSAIANLLSYEATQQQQRIRNNAHSSTLLVHKKSSSSMSLPKFSWNWNDQISKLKSHSNLHLQLTHRLTAKRALYPPPSSSVVVSSPHSNRFENALDDNTTSNTKLPALLNHIWIHNDTLRHKVERAVRTTLEFYKDDISWWQDWNFALTPKREMMFHFMMTAAVDDMECFVGKEDVEPVGFCELMMLKRPLLLQNKRGMMRNGEEEQEQEEVFVPCIVNLVVSPNHRRRGIGKRLVDCAVRAVRLYGQEWNVDLGVVGLFVEKGNVGAIALYEKVGFRVVENDKEDCQGQASGQEQIYMEMSTVDDDRIKEDSVSSSSVKSWNMGIRQREQEGVVIGTSR